MARSRSYAPSTYVLFGTICRGHRDLLLFPKLRVRMMDERWGQGRHFWLPSALQHHLPVAALLAAEGMRGGTSTTGRRTVDHAHMISTGGSFHHRHLHAPFL